MASTDRVRLVVLFGGQSAEHEVSCTTAAHVLAAVDPDRYEVGPVGITREGTWVQADDARAALAPARRPARPPGWRPPAPPVEPLPTVTPAADGLPVVVLPLLHGPHGEDGTVQGMLELAGVPYVGSGVLASALCMDKVKAKEVLAGHGLPQVPYVALRDTELDRDAAHVDGRGLAYPLFVKPANMGSSVGVTKVHDAAELAEAVALAPTTTSGSWSRRASTAARSRSPCSATPSPARRCPGEIVSSHEFYDYEDKYLDGTCDLLVPAPLDEADAERCGALALDAYRALRCDGMARVDFFYEEGGRGFLVNEVNTIPGFTPGSMYPKLWEATGVPYPDLIDELVRLAVERHERRSRFSTKR